jgi:acetyl esterase/lipase
MKKELGLAKQRASKLRAGIKAIDKSLAKAKNAQPLEAMQARRDAMEQELTTVDEQVQALEVTMKAVVDKKMNSEFDGVDVQRDIEFKGGVFLDLWKKHHQNADTAQSNSGEDDIFASSTKKCDCGTIVWLHGGGWKVGSHHNLPPFIRKLVLRGYTVASVGYTKSTQAKFPVCLHDCKVRMISTADILAMPGLPVAPPPPPLPVGVHLPRPCSVLKRHASMRQSDFRVIFSVARMQSAG